MLTRRAAILSLSSVATASAQRPNLSSLPCGPNSGMPFLAPSRDGGAILSWLEPLTPERYSLRASRWRKGAWSEPQEIAAGDNWFINWADFPSIVELDSGTLLAHWLDRVGKGAYGYGIRVARAETWGSKWTETFFAPPSDPKDYSGFLSFTKTPKGAAAVYLAPPPANPAAPAPAATTIAHSDHGMSEEGHRKTLRFVEFDAAGRPAGDRELDPDTCSCCQTTITTTRRGLIAAYRDHLPGEVRDISSLHLLNGQWSKPQPVHRDGWVINGCPTDGPSLASKNDTLAAVWLTRAVDTPKVQLALSRDGGATYSAPLRLDEGKPLGRPSLTMLGDDFLVTWLEKTTSGTEIRLRRVTPAGSLKQSVSVAPVPASRTTGFPRLVVSGDRILLTWREGRVQLATLDAASIA